MYFYKPRKKVFFCCVVVWPVITNHLFLCQVREVDSRFRRKKSRAASSLCFETTHPRGSSCVWTSALCRPASKAGRGACKGQRGRMDASFTVPSIPSNCPKLCFQACRKFSFELFGSVFVFVFFFPTLRKWLQKILIGIDDFILLFYTFFVSFSHLTKKKSHPSVTLPTFLLLWKTQNGNTLL